MEPRALGVSSTLAPWSMAVDGDLCNNLDQIAGVTLPNITEMQYWIISREPNEGKL